MAEDVHDRTGRLLMPSGMPLKDRHLRILMTWGITEVCVSDTKPNDTPADGETAPVTHSSAPPIAPHIQAQSETRAKDMFSHCDLTLPVNRVLYEAAVARLATDLSRKGHP